MGNVQCCASGRFPEGSPPKKPKNNKKKSNKLKGISKKSNGVGGGKNNGGVQKVVAVAEDASERAAPAATAEAQSQVAPPNEDAPVTNPVTQTQSSPYLEDIGSTEIDGPRNESMAAARERFFGQVSISTDFDFTCKLVS